MSSIRLSIPDHCNSSCDHRAIASTSMIDLMGRWWDWRWVAAICVHMMIATWSWRWCGGKHSIRWDWSFLLTILFERVEVKSSGFAGYGRWAFASWVIVEVWRMRSFHNCIRRSWWGVITTCTSRYRRWTCATDATEWTCAIANRSSSIICWNIFGFVAVTNVSHATRANRLIVNGINIPSSTYWWWCPALWGGHSRWRCVWIENLSITFHDLSHSPIIFSFT